MATLLDVAPFPENVADDVLPATQQIRPGKRTRARVAGLIPTPGGPIAEDMQTAQTGQTDR